MKKFVSILLALSVTASISSTITLADETTKTTTVTYNYDGSDHQRGMETLGRGLKAIKTGNSVFLSWRLLDSEDHIFGSAEENVSFNIYRGNQKIAAVTDVTNYTDTTVGSSYSVAPVVKGIEGKKCDSVSVMNNNYFDIALNKPADETIYDPSGNELYAASFFPADCSTGDVDGDGEYEIIVKWTSSEKDVGSPGTPEYSGTVRLAAYKMDGTKLWDSDINLGKNVYSSAHTVQFLVYDFDGDGKAEMMCQTSLGSKDAKGKYVSHASSDNNISGFTDDQNANADYRGGGRIVTGEEFLTVFNGETGAAIDTINLPTSRGGNNGAQYGDDFGNRSNRFVSDVAYLDGIKPYAVYLRGYYFGRNGQQRTSIAGISFDGQRLSPDYRFDTQAGEPGYFNGAYNYVGNGNHNCTVADVDDDGKDEFITGALCMEVNDDNEFKPRWCTHKEHGDALHIGDYDPTHKGFEFFTIHEDGDKDNKEGDYGYTNSQGERCDFGMSVIDADTGEILFHEGATADTGRGVMANIGMGGYYQIWSAKNQLQIANGGKSFSSGSKTGLSQNFRIFWDGDLYDELLDGTDVTSWNGRSMSSIFNASKYGCVQINGSKANPALQADLFGDWREELVYPTTDGNALRVFTTTTPTNYKMKTLMHDPVYRSGVAAEQTCYNQPPHVGMYLSDDIFKSAMTRIEFTPPSKTSYKVGEGLDLSDMSLVAYMSDGTSEVITNYVISSYNSMSAGEQTITLSYGSWSESFKVNVTTGFTCNNDGVITGYNGSETSAVIPEIIDGIEINSIAENAISGTSLSDIYIYDNIEHIGAGNFEEVIIHCYPASEAHIYAIENAIEYMLMENEADYIANIDFSENEYNSLPMLQSGLEQSFTHGNVQYKVGGRPKGGGDGQTGFNIGDNDGNPYLLAQIGRFHTQGRNAYISIPSPLANSDSSDNVLSMDIAIPNGNYSPYADVYDTSSNKIDTISVSNLGIEFNKWYHYELIYHGGSYHRFLSDTQGNIISYETIRVNSSSFAASIHFKDNSAISDNTRSQIAIDNFRMYSAAPALSNVTLTVKNQNDEPIKDANISISGMSLQTDKKGCANAFFPVGSYTASVQAEGYIESSLSLAAFRAEVSREIVMSVIPVSAEGLSLDKNSISLIPGMSGTLTPVFTPANATNKNVVWHTENENIATVTNGVVTAVSAGKTVVSATSEDGGFIASCEVNVYDPSSYTPVASSIAITEFPESAYVPNSGINTINVKAVVYDQYEIPMNSEVTWSCSEDSVTINDGSVSITADIEAESITVTASAGELSDSVSITLKELILKNNVYADLTYSDDLTIILNANDQTTNLGDVTLTIGKRSGSDNYTGFIASGGIMSVQAGRFSTSNRNAVMTFDAAPESFLANMDYVFETEIYFTKGVYPPKLIVSDNSGNSILLTSTELGIETNKWYKYQLIYSDGAYTAYIYDKDDNIVSIATPDFSGGPIKTIKFYCETDAPGNDGIGAQVKLDNTKYYSTDDAHSSFNVNVRSEDGTNMANMSVKIGTVTVTTNSLGNAEFTLPVGMYTAKLESSIYEGSVNMPCSSDGGDFYITAKEKVIPTDTPAPSDTPEPTKTPAPDDYKIVSVDSNIVKINVRDTNARIFAVKYDNLRLTAAKILLPEKSGETEFTLDFEPDNVFIWTIGNCPLDKWIKQ